MRSSVFSDAAGRFMRFRTLGFHVARDVEVGQDLTLGHQRNDLINVRIGIDVVHPNPYAQLAERGGKVIQIAF